MNSKVETSTIAVSSFLNSIDIEERRRDSKVLHQMMTELTNLKPAIWSGTMVGYGKYQYRYATGREGEWFRIGFAPRKQGMSLYLMSDFEGEEPLMKKIGKHKMGKSCMNFKRLSDLDEKVLRELIEKSAKGKICSEVGD